MSRIIPCGPGGIRITPLGSPDWLSRQTVPDMYPRQEDPFRPDPAQDPGCQLPPIEQIPGQFYDAFITRPGQRPVVVQRATNYGLTVPVVGNTIAITNQRFECDSMVIDVPSTAANSVFFGYGATVTATNGIEIQPGLPVLIEPENTREMWEIQRLLEFIAAILAGDHNAQTLAPYRAPRVVFNAGEWFLTSPGAATTPAAVMLFHVPELQ